jgi:hypothetical protein
MGKDLAEKVDDGSNEVGEGESEKQGGQRSIV